MSRQFNQQQLAAIEAKGSNILVSASAGSGKTTVLIERIIRHVLSDYASLDQLLVVTFTEMAANEMKERLEMALKQQINHSKDPELKRNLMRQLSILPEAHIRTLHSFCLTVIQQFFYLDDIDPEFTLLTDATQIELLKEEAWEALLELIIDDSPSIKVSSDEYLTLLRSFSKGRNDDRLYQMINQLCEFARSNPDPLGWMENISHPDHFLLDFSTPFYQSSLIEYSMQLIKEAKHQWQLALQLTESLSEDTLEKYATFIQEDAHIAESLIQHFENNQYEEAINLIHQHSWKRWASYRRDDEDKEIIQLAKKYRDQAVQRIKELTNVFPYSYSQMQTHLEGSQVIVNSLSHLAIGFYHQFQRLKRQNKLIDYNDLEHITLQLLAPMDPKTRERQPSIAAHFYQNQFKEVMVDEYQDINELQGLILHYLSHETKSTGNLFMVGDVKQSIYGFRMADPSLFLSKYERYQTSTDQQLIILDTNYRSRDNVLGYTNHVFERIMDKNLGEMTYAEAESLKTGFPYFIEQQADSDYNAEFLLFNKDTMMESNEDLEGEFDTSREAEAHLIAQKIRYLIDSNQQIYDKSNGGFYRKIEYNDIVILSSTKNSFLTLQRIFDQYEIPLLSQKIESYFQRQEIQLMLALLKIIDNPHQDIPLVAILRSYFVGLSDEQLSLIRIYSQTTSYFQAVLAYANAEDTTTIDQTLQGKIQEFLSQLRHWQRLADEISLAELIWQIYMETDFLSYNAGLSNGLQRMSNLHGLYQRASDFESHYFRGIFGFIRYIEKVIDRDKDLQEPVLLDHGQNYVRMMTVHASKGLEFPIVFLMNTGQKMNLKELRETMVLSKEHGIGIDYIDTEYHLKYPTIHKEAIKKIRERQLKSEEMRKLYVALTRAEQKIYIVGTIASQNKWEEMQQLLLDHGDQSKTIPLMHRLKAASWLDWLQQALYYRSLNSSNAVHIYTMDQLISKMVDENNVPQDNLMQYYQKNFALTAHDTPDDTLLDSMLFQYSFPLSTKTASYQSVSELKRLFEEPLIDKANYLTANPTTLNLSEIESELAGIRYTQGTFNEPKLIQSNKNQSLTPTEKGTLIHYLMQSLNYQSFNNIDITHYSTELVRQVQLLSQTIDSKFSLIDLEILNKIISYLTSELGQLIIHHHNQIKVEQAFSMTIPASKLYLSSKEQEDTLKYHPEDQILIHGVIDAYLIVDQRVILLDYKTNRYQAYSNQSKQEQIKHLSNTYRFQLSLYAHALSLVHSIDVTEVYLVLIDFEEVVPLTDLYQF